MANRTSSPDAAFAYVGEVNGISFKLLRHHKLDAVKNGSEHDTVDKDLLVTCLRMVDQIPVNNEERGKVRAHLASHASFFQLDLAEEGVAQRIIHQQDSGFPQQGVKEVSRKENDGEVFEPPIELTPKNSTPKSAEAKVILNDEEKEVSNPNTDKTDDDPDSPPAGGNNKVVQLDECDLIQESPNTDKVGKASLNEKEINNLTDKIVEKVDEMITKVKEIKKKVTEENIDQSISIHRMGKPHKGKKKKLKHKLPKARRSVYNLAVRDIVINEEGKIGIVTSVREKDLSVCLNGSREKIKIDEFSAAKFKVLAHSNSDPNLKIALEKGLTIVDSEEALARMTLTTPKTIPIPATPTLEEQNKKGGKVFLADDQEKLTENPNKDKVGKAALLYVTIDDLTEEGRKLILKRFGDALNNKIEAKIQSVEKIGSVDFITVKLGDDKEFPMHVMMDVMRDGEGKVLRVRILNESLPATILADFAQFLNKLSKESAKASVDQATAPAKLERCVAKVLPQRVANFKKRKGRAPNAKEMKQLESSAFAICQASLKKS